MKMKKITKLLITAASVIALTGCGNNATIKEKRTIILDVDSDVIPNFSSNFGLGSYDESTGKYTHTIDYIKDLYIFMSYDDLKTKTIYIPTSEMTSNIINKQVEFGESLDAEVEITIDGVKNLEGLEIDDSVNLTNLSVGKKNTFKFTLPSRNQSYNIRFTLPNYREFNINLEKKDLISGQTKLNTIAITEDKSYIGFKGSEFSYSIYSSTTHDLIASGNKWQEDNKIEYVLVPKDDSYYLMINPSGGYSSLHKTVEGEDIIFDVSKASRKTYGYMYFQTNEDYYSDVMIYDKVNNTIIGENSLYNEINDVGLIIRNNENNWLYLEDLASKAIDMGNNWYYQYTINYDDFVPVTLNVTRINKLSNEIIANGENIDFSPSSITSVSFNNNVFDITTKEMENGIVYVDLKTESGELIKTIDDHYIGSYFNGEIFTGTIEYQNRKIPYQFPVFLDQLVYNQNNGNYSYPAQVIDVNLSYVSINFIDNTGNQYALYDTYIMDEQFNVIMGNNYGGNYYFEVYENKTYTSTINNKKYTFTVTKEILESGTVLIVDEAAPKAKLKVPDGYTIKFNRFENRVFTPNEEGIVEVPSRIGDYLSGKLSNGFAEIDFWIGVTEEVYTFLPFYALSGGVVLSNNDYNVNTVTGSNGIVYSYISSYEKDQINTIPNEIETSLYTSNNECYKINLSEFVYNSDIKAYYFDFKTKYDYRIEMDNRVKSWATWSGEYVCYYSNNGSDNWYAYVKEGTTIEYNSDTYTIKSGDEGIIIKIEYSYNESRYVINAYN